MNKIATFSVLGLIGALIIVILTAIIMYFTISNSEVRLRSQVDAQKKNVEAVFDNTWKIIQQQAQVSSEYKDSFREIYSEIMGERYDNARGGALMSWITEQNPNFDVSLYKTLQISIEAQRTNFTREQKKLIDLKREHDVYLTVFPNSLFVGGRPKIEITIITTEKTKEVYRTSEENDVNLF